MLSGVSREVLITIAILNLNLNPTHVAAHTFPGNATNWEDLASSDLLNSTFSGEIYNIRIYYFLIGASFLKVLFCIYGEQSLLIFVKIRCPVVNDWHVHKESGTLWHFLDKMAKLVILKPDLPTS